MSCPTASPCLVSATITAGRTVIAQHPQEYIAGRAPARCYFQLTGAGARCSRTPAAGRLPVRVKVHGSSGRTRRRDARPGAVRRHRRGTAAEPRAVLVAADHRDRRLRLGRTASARSWRSVRASPLPCDHHALDRIDGHRRHRQRVRRRQRAGLPEFHAHHAGRAAITQSAKHGNQLGVHLALSRRQRQGEWRHRAGTRRMKSCGTARRRRGYPRGRA